MIAVLYSGSKPELIKKTWSYAFRSQIELNAITSDGDYYIFKMESKTRYMFISSEALLLFMRRLGKEAENVDFGYDEDYK